jgi:hypothetical protein
MGSTIVPDFQPGPAGYIKHSKIDTISKKLKALFDSGF